jgi:hypothetical protein
VCVCVCVVLTLTTRPLNRPKGSEKGPEKENCMRSFGSIVETMMFEDVDNEK